MLKRKEIIPFQAFMDQSYKKKKQTKIYSIGPISPFAFFICHHRLFIRM